jgi:hypothetical protein
MTNKDTEIILKEPIESVKEKDIVAYLKSQTLNLDDKQIEQFIAVAQASQLNPLKREIYAI